MKSQSFFSPIGRCLFATIAVFAWIAITDQTTVYGETALELEYRVKAAQLYFFAKFTQWPAKAIGDASQPISFVILGKDPFGDALEKNIKGKTIKGHQTVIHRIQKLDDLKKCHILFVCASEKKNGAKILDTIKNRNILTVGDFEGFAEQGGIINFIKIKNNVRFEINVDASNRAKLKINAQVLGLAKIVKDRRRD